MRLHSNGKSGLNFPARNTRRLVVWIIMQRDNNTALSHGLLARAGRFALYRAENLQSGLNFPARNTRRLVVRIIMQCDNNTALLRGLLVRAGRFALYRAENLQSGLNHFTRGVVLHAALSRQHNMVISRDTRSVWGADESAAYRRGYAYRCETWRRSSE